MRAISIPPEPTRPTSPVITDAVSLLRAQVQWANRLLEVRLAELASEQSGGSFPDCSHRLGRYAHALCVEDGTINALLKGGAPLFATTWADQVQWSPPPPRPDRADEAWARRVQDDLAALRRYATAVFAATDEYLASLTPEVLARTVNLSSTGLGPPTVAWVVSQFVLGELASACSAVSVVRRRAGVVGRRTSAASSSPARSERTLAPDLVWAPGLPAPVLHPTRELRGGGALGAGLTRAGLVASRVGR